MPALTEKGAARGSYQGGTPDGSRPGVFYFNAYDLPSRTTPGMETLYLHEGAPGHHFQISLAQEDAGLPPFQRFGGNTAFVEGWGLYAESLGPELGVYTDPYQYFGYLDSQLFRAIRLVVDTGIHAKGWTRDQSIDYILANSSRGRTNATSETERYIAIPGQALAYKMGELKIRAAAGQGREGAGPEVRHPRLPRPGADVGRPAARRARSQDRPLDREQEITGGDMYPQGTCPPPIPIAPDEPPITTAAASNGTRTCGTCPGRYCVADRPHLHRGWTGSVCSMRRCAGVARGDA